LPFVHHLSYSNIALHGGEDPRRVEVILFRVDHDTLYNPANVSAGQYRWGAGQSSQTHALAWALLTALQLRAGRWVHFCVLNGMQVIRFVFARPVAEACGMTDALMGSAVDARGSISRAFSHDRLPGAMIPFGSIEFDVAPRS